MTEDSDAGGFHETIVVGESCHNSPPRLKEGC